MNIATEINKEVLGQIAAESIAKINPSSQNGKRWINAIAKATAEIETNPFMTYEIESHSLLMMSQTSNEVYTANGTCQCKAFANGFPCCHCAAARLITLYIERTRQRQRGRRINGRSRDAESAPLNKWRCFHARRFETSQNLIFSRCQKSTVI